MEKWKQSSESHSVHLFHPFIFISEGGESGGKMIRNWEWFASILLHFMPVDHLTPPETVSVTVILKKRVKQKSEMGVVPSRAMTLFKLNWDPFISSPQSPPYEKNDAYLYLKCHPWPFLHGKNELPGYSLQNLWSIWFETFHTNMPRWIIFTTLKQEYSCYKTIFSNEIDISPRDD